MLLALVRINKNTLFSCLGKEGRHLKIEVKRLNLFQDDKNKSMHLLNNKKKMLLLDLVYKNQTPLLKKKKKEEERFMK